MAKLLLQLLALSLWPLALVVLVAIGQFIALFVWDRMFVREERRADRTGTEPWPPNVFDLAEWKARRATT